MSKKRPICKTCNTKPRAISYTRPSGTVQYRSLCESCLKLKKQNKLPKEKPPVSKWESSGYKKKMVCDLCKFRAQYSSQTVVAHVDGNLENCQITNLRTLCLNCADAAKRKTFTWRLGGLEPDR